jgi:4-hydroxyphenylacetate 3-monooxygenase
MDKYYTLNENWQADDRRKLLAFARDLISSDYAGHRLAFQMFAQSPRFNQLQAVYRNFDWDGPLDFVKNSAGLSDQATGETKRAPGDAAVNRWFANREAPKRAAE